MRKFLLISIIANLALVVLVAYGIRQRSTAPAAQRAPVELADAFTVATNAPVKVELPDDSVATGSTSRLIQNWRDIESTDFHEYMENLRRIGCPEETVADIIISEVSEMFRARLAQLPSVPRREFKYWQTGPTQLYPRLDPALEKARRDIETERDELLRALLGPNYATYKVPRGAAEKWMNDDFFAALPAGKRNQLFDIDDRYNAAVKAIKDHRGNYMDDEDRKQLQQLREQRDLEISAVLDPEELAQFQARLSDEAETVRKTILSVFDASEEEFRAIVAARIKSSNDPATGSSDDELKRILGEDRYDEFRLSNNYEYRQLVQLAQKQNLPREVARNVFDLKAKVEGEVLAIRADRSRSIQDIMQRVSDLRTQTLEQIATLLGPEGFKQYYPSASWIRSLPSTNPKEFQPGSAGLPKAN